MSYSVVLYFCSNAALMTRRSCSALKDSNRNLAVETIHNRTENMCSPSDDDANQCRLILAKALNRRIEALVELEDSENVRTRFSINPHLHGLVAKLCIKLCGTLRMF